MLRFLIVICVMLSLLNVCVCRTSAVITIHEPGWSYAEFAEVTAPSIGIDFDLENNVYVATCGGHYVTIPVWKINPQGTPTPFGDPIACGDSLAFNSAILLHASSGVGEIFKIQADGTTTLFVSGGGLNNVNGMDFDSSDVLFAANTTTGTISKILPSGAITTFASGITYACGIVIDANDYIYTTSNSSIYRISPAGDVEFYLTLPGSLRYGLAFDSQNYLYASSLVAGIGYIYKVAPDRTYSAFISGLNNPFGIGIDTHGDIYIAENDLYLIYRFFRVAPTHTPSPTITYTMTNTMTATPTLSATATKTYTATLTITQTSTATMTPEPPGIPSTTVSGAFVCLLGLGVLIARAKNKLA